MLLSKPVLVVSLISTVLVISGCASKSVEETEVTVKTGRIIDLEYVEVEEEERKSNTSLRLSSGSRSGNVGFGISLSLPLGNNEPEIKQLSRYTVKLSSGEERQIDYPDDYFLIGDCIDIIEVEGSEKPAELQLSADSCPDN